MKKSFILLAILAIVPYQFVCGQLTIEECHRKAQENYPLVKRYNLIEQSKEYNLSNANKGYLPQLSLSAKASYQSDVTEIPIKLPNVNIEGMRKDQYQAVLELNQTIWDGGNIHAQKNITKANSDIERQQLDVDMYAINDRVNQLFFGILSLDAQLRQNELLRDELKRNYQQVSAYVENGIANQADLDAVKVEQLNTTQRRNELEATQKAYNEMLSTLIGMQIGRGEKLIKPDQVNPLVESEINRPELLLFTAQNEYAMAQKQMLQAKNLPKLGLYVQGAYGNPGLNMLKNEFEPYYIAGVRLSWNFGNLYTKKNESRQIELSQTNINVQKEAFLFNTNLQVTQENNEIDKLAKLMKDDDEIISLRTNIKKAAEAKVANGTLTVTEMLREITAEDLARQNKALHEIQLLMAIYNLKNTTNN